MEEIKYYITKINNLLYKIETTNQNYLKHFYQYRLHIYLILYKVSTGIQKGSMFYRCI